MAYRKSPLATFLRKMASHDRSSVTAAVALYDFVLHNRSAAEPLAKDIAAYLQSPKLALRAVTARILSAINTRESLDLLFSGFREQPPDVLSRKTAWPGSSPLPLAWWWLVDALTDHEVEAGRDDALHRLVVSFLSEVASSGDTYSERVRAIALEALDFYIEEYHPDIRATIKLPQHVYDSAIELADHDDTKVSSRALQLLGKISHRIEEMPRVPATSAQQQRIDFDKTDLKSVIEHYGPYRFADVHPEDFEKIIAQLFRRGGFSVQETSYTGDYGADLVASKGEERVAIQVKRYGPTNSVGVGEVNQVLGGMRYYDCNRCLVITTSRFTPAAIEMAKRAKVVLWDWDVLVRQIQKVCGISLR